MGKAIIREGNVKITLFDFIMKKLLILPAMILIFTPLTAFASPQFDRILSEKISEIGIYDGTSGIIYAGAKNFQENNSLFIAEITSESIECLVYDDTDGIQLTDRLTLPFSEKNCKLSAAAKDGSDYILFSSKNGNDCYTIINDTFSKTNISDFSSITPIIESKNGKIISHTDSSDIYQFLKQLKENTISEYTMPNRLNLIAEDELTKMKRTITACADIMSFDIKDYDYDTLFQYVLYTHQNFRLLTDIDPQYGNSSNFGYNNVSLVSSEFIDYIMENIFHISPEKPPVNNLLSRGFCYSNNYYFYTGGFNVYFSTQILDIAAVYDLGGNVYYVVFSDIYNENNISKPEYSFAVLQKTNNGYSLLRLGMGEILPSQSDIYVYSPFSIHNKMKWKHSSGNWQAEKTPSKIFLLPVLLITISVGMIGLVCAVIILIKTKK